MERRYNVPLRREAMKAPRHERAKRATKALKQFVSKHMKTESVSLEGAVNEKIWERGMKNPPHHIEITATKDDDGAVRVALAPQVTVRGKAVKTPPRADDTKSEESAEDVKQDAKGEADEERSTASSKASSAGSKTETAPTSDEATTPKKASTNEQDSSKAPSTKSEEPAKDAKADEDETSASDKKGSSKSE